MDTKGREYWTCPPEIYFSTVAVFYKNFPLSELVSFVWNNGVAKFLDPIDLLLGRFCLIKQIPIFVIQPSLAQHLGVVGHNGSAQSYLQSETFNTSCV
jgi:hypothetical protein